MGRLIDEDVLLKNLEWLEDYDHYVLHDVKMSIDETPTVKAIPIEWIRKWYDEETHRLGDGWTHVEHPYSMKRMIEDWEKENEKDI